LSYYGKQSRVPKACTTSAALDCNQAQAAKKNNTRHKVQGPGRKKKNLIIYLTCYGNYLI